MTTNDDEKCQFADRPFSRLDPGLCGAPATHTIYAPEIKPFRCCEKHFRQMTDSSFVENLKEKPTE